MAVGHYVLFISLLSIKLWYYYGYHLWENSEVEKSIVYRILSDSISWYLNIYTLIFTFLISLALSIIAIIMLVFKFSGKFNKLSYRFLIVWLVVNLINVPLWFKLLVMQ